MAEPFFKYRKFSLSEGELLTADIEDDYDALNAETFGSSGANGGPVGEDWERGHEKFAELVTHRKGLLKDTQPAFKPFFDEDEDDDFDDQLTDFNEPTKAKWDTQEIVVQTLSQLGLEDDLDDSNLSSSNSNRQGKPFQSLFGSSAPPALLTAEDCGSPKTRSIWSADDLYSLTPVQDQRLTSLLKSLQAIKVPSAPPASQQDQISSRLVGGSHGPPPPFLANAHRLEDIERDLLQRQPPKPSDITCGWASPRVVSPKTILAEQLEEEMLNRPSPSNPITCSKGFTLNGLAIPSKPSQPSSRGWDSCEPLQTSRWKNSSPPLAGTVRTLDDIEKDILLKPRAPTVEEVERYMQGGRVSTAPNMAASNNISRGPLQAPIGTPPQGSPLLSMLSSGNLRTSPVPIPTFSSSAGRTSPVRTNNHFVSQASSNVLPPHPILNPSRHMPQFTVAPRPISNVSRNHNSYHSHSSPRASLYSADLRRILYPRQIHHPLLNIQWNPMPQQPNLYNQQDQYQQHYQQPGYFRSTNNKDDYDGLMTRGEKEWLIKIQMLQLHTDNPYVDDYYFTKFNMCKLAQQQKKKATKGEEVKLMLPERVKHETKTYVPMQFEGSLGKLQAISVNFPRKVLDVHNITGEEDNSRNPANKELHRQRKLLVDIEKLYTILLDIDDEEKMMCALPQEAHIPHKENREKLLDSLFQGLGCTSLATDDRFLHIASIRKGRHLLLRALALFKMGQQAEFLGCLLQHLGPIVRWDKPDKVLEHYLEDTILPVVEQLNLNHLLILGKGLAHNLTPNASSPLEPSSKESTLLVNSLHTRFGFSILCIILNRAETLFTQGLEVQNDTQSQWSELVKVIVKHMTMQGDLVLPEVEVCTSGLWAHLQRLQVQEEQVDLLKAKRDSLISRSDSNGNDLSVN